MGQITIQKNIADNEELRVITSAVHISMSRILLTA